MLKSASLFILMLSSTILVGQNLSMTFTASGAASKVDSVKATNLRTNQHVTLAGQDTLILSWNTGINTLSDQSGQGIVFPNPFQEKTTIAANISEAQTVSLRLYNLAGQSIARTQAFVQPGSNTFALALSKTGIYMVSITTNTGTTGIKIICTESTGDGDMIRYTGAAQGFLPPPLKAVTIYTLGYSAGDIILYRCKGGIHTTIITDSPAASKKYEVQFVPCIDPAGKSYAIVEIGSQTWMAENLAWLPAVSPSAIGSDSLKYYYIYNYEDTVVAAAKNTLNYQTYGVLYNWPAAMNQVGKKTGAQGPNKAACPAGWHMPDDDEWKILEKSLGMSQQDADTLYLRSSGDVGKKLKSSTDWSGSGQGSNFSGFSALPGGYRNLHGGFESLDQHALFWSSTLADSTAYYRSLSVMDNGVYRIATLKNHGLAVRCVRDPL